MRYIYMQSWSNFLISLFWLSLLAFLLNPTNFITALIYSESSWTLLYAFVILSSLTTDNGASLVISFFILGLAGVEFSIGFMLTIVFKYFNKSINLTNLNSISASYVKSLAASLNRVGSL